MQMESFQNAREKLAVEAMASEGCLHEAGVGPKRGCLDLSTLPKEFLPADSAMRGLASAVPMALSLWMAIGLLLWKLLR